MRKTLAFIFLNERSQFGKNKKQKTTFVYFQLYDVVVWFQLYGKVVNKRL